jgi:hypothetical protein
MKKILFCLCLLMLAIFSFSVSVYAQPAPLGACCYSNNTKCEGDVTEQSCLTEPPDGIWHEGVSCDQNPCVQSVPTVTQRGMIIFIVLAGLGAVYFMRRQRKAAR